MDMKIISGRIILSKEIPAAFMASNSNRSPKLPKVIRAASKIAKGNEAGTSVSAE